MFDPTAELERGMGILKPIFEPHGFLLADQRSGEGSGAKFSSAAFVRAARRFEFHVRYSLGLVTYRIGILVLAHEDYLRMLGVYEHRHYPNFDKDVQRQFEGLAADLREFGQDFLSGSGQRFQKLAADFAANPTQFKGLPV